MNAITIPEKLAKKGGLVIIPRDEYEHFLRLKKRELLDKDLIEALKDVRAGRLIGPFKTMKEGRRAWIGNIDFGF